MLLTATDISLKFMYSLLVTEFLIFWYNYTLESIWLLVQKNELSVMFCFIIITIYFKLFVPFNSLPRDIQMSAKHSWDGAGFPRANWNSPWGLSYLVFLHLISKQSLSRISWKEGGP
jgi:hypothetical protein